jgi:hypothetical protein
MNKVITNVLKFAVVNSNVQGKTTGMEMDFNDNFLFSLEKSYLYTKGFNCSCWGFFVVVVVVLFVFFCFLCWFFFQIFIFLIIIIFLYFFNSLLSFFFIFIFNITSSNEKNQKQSYRVLGFVFKCNLYKSYFEHR